MAMKILLMVMLVTALRHGVAENCKTRSALTAMNRLRNATRCKEPQDAMVPLPVPEGFDYVSPSVVKLKQCTGLACQIFPEKCFPDPKSITTKTYKVNAYNVRDHLPNCVEVQVEEHGACNCRCEEIECPPNQVFQEGTCQCECDPVKKKQCNERRSKHAIRTQWLHETCSCKCVLDEPCGSGMTWVEELCRCMNLDDLDRMNYLDYL